MITHNNLVYLRSERICYFFCNCFLFKCAVSLTSRAAQIKQWLDYFSTVKGIANDDDNWFISLSYFLIFWVPLQLSSYPEVEDETFSLLITCDNISHCFQYVYKPNNPWMKAKKHSQGAFFWSEYFSTFPWLYLHTFYSHNILNAGSVSLKWLYFLIGHF